MRRPWPTRGCRAMEKIMSAINLTDITSKFDTGIQIGNCLLTNSILNVCASLFIILTPNFTCLVTKMH